MRKKFISKTYLRGVSEYELKILFDKEDYYLSIKKILKIEEPFIIQGRTLMDNGYYVAEVLPKKENYAMRVFFNDKKERLEYYFDITLENGMDEDTNIPYYVDLYTDVTIGDGKVEVLDEDELQDALDNKVITIEQFHLANNTRDILLESIKKDTNPYMKIEIEKYL